VQVSSGSAYLKISPFRFYKFQAFEAMRPLMLQSAEAFTIFLFTRKGASLCGGQQNLLFSTFNSFSGIPLKLCSNTKHKHTYNAASATMSQHQPKPYSPKGDSYMYINRKINFTFGIVKQITAPLYKHSGVQRNGKQNAAATSLLVREREKSPLYSQRAGLEAAKSVIIQAVDLILTLSRRTREQF